MSKIKVSKKCLAWYLLHKVNNKKGKISFIYGQNIRNLHFRSFSVLWWGRQDEWRDNTVDQPYLVLKCTIHSYWSQMHLSCFTLIFTTY